MVDTMTQYGYNMSVSRIKLLVYGDVDRYYRRSSYDGEAEADVILVREGEYFRTMKSRLPSYYGKDWFPLDELKSLEGLHIAIGYVESKMDLEAMRTRV